ncbi:MAG: hypothetical protein KGY65_08450 [Candidatus Thermoplasmatota archaeon]|nr:hypothetical protein [Candidatus Thermoplasmatota archaeon]MBS3802763.1 hypothetical protein [Candidatus Thermoplasmatota archaeon]
MKKTIDINIRDEHICISHLELQIAFKEVILKSPKDLEDAQHLRSVAKEYLDHSLSDLLPRHKCWGFHFGRCSIAYDCMILSLFGSMFRKVGHFYAIAGSPS